ncbi:hypothetical protein MHZ93_20985 [Roseomonas sp. ACRSG]|nr:hypothetical protein [Roseomonas sp. ACRSG]
MPPSLTLAGQDPLGQFRHLAKVRGSEQPIPLTATRFSVRILGTLALVTAERCFRNVERQSIEATMTFPVPVQAALVGLSAQIGGRRLVAQTQRKAQARERYEAAMLIATETWDLPHFPCSQIRKRRCKPLITDENSANGGRFRKLSG